MMLFDGKRSSSAAVSYTAVYKYFSKCTEVLQQAVFKPKVLEKHLEYCATPAHRDGFVVRINKEKQREREIKR